MTDLDNFFKEQLEEDAMFLVISNESANLDPFIERQDIIDAISYQDEDNYYSDDEEDDYLSDLEDSDIDALANGDDVEIEYSDWEEY